MTELQKYIRDPRTNKPRRGAYSRIGEKLGVSASTVMRWNSGEYKPGAEMELRIRQLISEKIDISSRQAGRSGKRLKTKPKKPCKN